MADSLAAGRRVYFPYLLGLNPFFYGAGFPGRDPGQQLVNAICIEYQRSMLGSEQACLHNMIQEPPEHTNLLHKHASIIPGKHNIRPFRAATVRERAQFAGRRSARSLTLAALNDQASLIRSLDSREKMDYSASVILNRKRTIP
jgi:hypothetical protein